MIQLKNRPLTADNDNEFLKLFHVAERYAQEKHKVFNAVIKEAFSIYSEMDRSEISKNNSECSKGLKDPLTSYIWRELTRVNLPCNLLRKDESILAKDSIIIPIIGETGQGKSTLTNAICRSYKAKEGHDIISETTEATIHRSEIDEVYVIDTPGFFDTRIAKSKNIMNEIERLVSKELQEQSKLNAVFLIWNPCMSYKFRFEAILHEIQSTFGKNVLDSLVIVVNVMGDEYTKRHEDGFKAFLQENKSNYQFPVVKVDAKNLSEANRNELIRAVDKVQPYHDDYFKALRRKKYYEIFLSIQKEVEEKRRKEEEEVKKLEAKMRKIEAQRKTEFEEQLKRQAEQKRKIFEEELDRKNKAFLQEQERIKNYQLEMLERERQEESKRDEERRRRRDESEERRRQRRIEEEEEQRLRYAQEIHLTKLKSIIFQQSYSSPQYGGGSFFNTSTTTPVGTSEKKFYKGGQFMPGGGRAPKGGAFG